MLECETRTQVTKRKSDYRSPKVDSPSNLETSMKKPDTEKSPLPILQPLTDTLEKHDGNLDVSLKKHNTVKSNQITAINTQGRMGS